MREYSPGHPLVFCHIPKSAGTSLTAALIASLQPERPVVGVDLTLLGGYELEGLSAVVQAGIIGSPEDLPADASLVAGHISPGTTMARFPDADHITTLRNPRNRVASQWIHSRALSEFDLRHWGSVGTAFRLGRLPLAEYLQQSIDRSQHRQHHHSLPGVAASAPATRRVHRGASRRGAACGRFGPP